MRGTGKVWLRLPFGGGEETVAVDAESLLGVVLPQDGEEPGDEAGLVRQALAQPVGSPPLRRLVRSGQKVAIITSDLTRPCPSERLLPAVLDELAAGGIADADIEVIIALGLHRPMEEAELRRAVGEAVFSRVRVTNHDPENTVHLGVTSAGTPVELFTPLVEADVRVCLGNLEFHYFAGFSGGAKAILPGCASRATVDANHAMMVRPEAVAGRLEDNPVRRDIEEGVDMVGVDFILNVVVDGQHRIVEAVAGNVERAHRQGCQRVVERGAVAIEARADIALVSAGGYPKDVNLYQAQKALDNAAGAVRQGGVIIWLAECREGLGEETFEEWLLQASSPDELVQRIQREFVLGGHKAAAMAAVQQRAGVYLVSALEADLVRRCGMEPFTGIDQALARARQEVGPTARIVAMPQGGSVLPVAPD
ncbi:MAG: nickel-dependent lactate racemase [Candidatus Latescibacteria bacterium]|nr:nickel-dependent lactate racemase [Candidatus Latescibacterota bacterium]